MTSWNKKDMQHFAEEIAATDSNRLHAAAKRLGTHLTPCDECHEMINLDEYLRDRASKTVWFVHRVNKHGEIADWSGATPEDGDSSPAEPALCCSHECATKQLRAIDLRPGESAFIASGDDVGESTETP